MVAIEAWHYQDPEREQIPAFLLRPKGRNERRDPPRPSRWRWLKAVGAALVPPADLLSLVPLVRAAPTVFSRKDEDMAGQNNQAPSAAPSHASALAQNVIKQFKVIASTVRSMLGDPFFLELLEGLKQDTERSILAQLKAAGMPATLAQISTPVIDLETAAEVNFLREQLDRIGRLQGQDAAAAPTLALQALRARKNEAGDFIPGGLHQPIEPERATH